MYKEKVIASDKNRRQNNSKFKMKRENYARLPKQIAIYCRNEYCWQIITLQICSLLTL